MKEPCFMRSAMLKQPNNSVYYKGSYVGLRKEGVGMKTWDPDSNH